MEKSLLPPFTAATASEKVRLIEDALNIRDLARILPALSAESRWLDQGELIAGHEAICVFLARRWSREHDCRLILELWAFGENRIAVRSASEWNDGGKVYRSHGNESWEFDADGLLCQRSASSNRMAIKAEGSKLRWPLGRRPVGYPSLTELGL